MKRMLFSLVLLVSLPVMAFAERVELVRAQKVAQTFLSNNGVKSAQLTDVAPSAGFTNLYIFNANPGFVVMAADDRVEPILGYSLEGQFVAEGMPENVRWWLQGYEDGIQWAVDNGISASSETARQWQDLERGVKGPRTEVVVGPLVQTHWAQNAPYNNLCPSGCVTGCVATAMAQILKCWQPATGVGSHAYPWNSQIVSADFGATTYDWDNMLNSYGSSNAQQKLAVATLMFHCGVSTEMKYGPSASGTNNKRAATAYQVYFDCDAVYHQRSEYENQDEVWIAMLKEDLNQQRPVQYGGEGTPGGHSFVCDGYDADGRFHFNYGWADSSDGYFTIQGNGFPNNQDAVFHIAPRTSGASAPSELNYTLNGYDVALSWTGGQDAVSYNVYHNNTLIANTTDCNCAGEAGFGHNTYYIRAVDMEGRLSSPSNTVAVEIDTHQQPVVDDLTADYVDGDVALSWSTPWWYPQSVTGSLSYVEKIRPDLDRSLLWTDETIHLFWGVRFAPEDLAGHGGESLFSASFYVYQPGSFEVLVYQGTKDQGSDDERPDVLLTRKIVTTADNGWIDVKMDEPAVIDASLDLWVFILDVGGTVREIPVLVSEVSHYQYFGGSTSGGVIYPHQNCQVIPGSFKRNWLIVAYLTDGTYTYNLYRDDEAIASQISETQYTDSGLEDGTYTYVVKTNYSGGESEASNSVMLKLFSHALAAGWNWWAPTVVSSTLLSQLEQALGTSGILVNSQSDGFARYANGNWESSLTGLVAGQMYRIQTSAPCQFTLSGAPATDVTVTIVPGYNWFGYTGTESLRLADLDISPAPTPGDKINSQEEGFAVYNGTMWSGTLTSLQPGKGYVYISTATVDKTITF